MDTTQNLTNITDLSDNALDVLLGIDPLDTLRAEADPTKNITSAMIRAYGIAKPSAVRDGTVPAALRGHRGSRAEIAMDLGYKAFEFRSWM